MFVHVKSPGWLPVQVSALVTLVTVKVKLVRLFGNVFVTCNGWTPRITVAPLPSGAFVVCTNPSLHTTVHGLSPVRFACNCTSPNCPLQIVCPVTSDAFGLGFTVTNPVPVMSPGWFP